MVTRSKSMFNHCCLPLRRNTILKHFHKLIVCEFLHRISLGLISVFKFLFLIDCQAVLTMMLGFADVFRQHQKPPIKSSWRASFFNQFDVMRCQSSAHKRTNLNLRNDFVSYMQCLQVYSITSFHRHCGRNVS